MSDIKLHLRGIDGLIIIICIVASSIIFLSDVHEFNKALLFLPIVFVFCYTLILAPLRNRTASKTVLWFTIAEFIRLVFVPCYESINQYVGFYGFSTDDTALLTRSVLLMSYECLFLSVFLFIILRHRVDAVFEVSSSGNDALADSVIEDKTEVASIGKDVLTDEVLEDKTEITPLGKDVLALVIVLLIGVFIYFIVPEVRRTINFLVLESNSAKIRALTTGSHSSLVVGLITFTYYSFLCGFIIALDYAKRRYDLSGRKLYVFLGAFFGVITVSFINGESRSTTVYTLYAIIQCLCICFKRYKKHITRVLFVSGGVVLLGITAYRLFAVYKHSSYSDAIQGGSLRDNYIPAFIEMYCLGPQSVACGIQFSDLMHGDFTIGTFFYDIFRPFMGLNFIAKAFDGSTSIMMYNSWFSGVQGKSNGLFLQIANQGYCYFGLFLAPVFACVFLRIAIFIERKLKQTKNLFLIFFFNFVYIRLATCVIAGTMSGYITTITMSLIMCGSIYLLQKFVSSTIRRKI